MAPKSARNFYLLHRIPLDYFMGEKCTPNYSISNGFWDIYNFLFSAKIQDGRQKWWKLKFEKKKKNWNRISLYYPVSQKLARNGSISYDLGDIYNCLFSAKIKDGCQKFRKLKFFPFA